MFRYKIQNMADTEKGIIWLHGVIGLQEDGLESVNIMRVLNEMDSKGIEKIVVHINSPGGYVFDGLSIFNALSERDCEVIIDGLAASIASVIACAGKSIRMYKNAFFMIHNPWTFAIGDSAYMKKVADQMTMIKDSIMSAYTDRTGLDTAALAQMMDDETWLNAGDSLENGFCDEVIDKKSTVDTEKVKNQFFNFIKITGDLMDREYLIKFFSLSKDATDEQIKSAMENMQNEALQAAELMETVSNLQEQISNLPDDQQTVIELQNSIKALTAQVDNLMTGNNKAEAERVVNELISQGKVFPAQKETYVKDAMDDLEAFRAKAEKMPQLFDPKGGIEIPEKKDEKPKEYQAGDAADFIRQQMAVK